MSERADVRTVVASMVDAVNRGDLAAATAAFTAEPVIVEDIPPFRWQGRSAVADWLAAMGDTALQLGVITVIMELGRQGRTEIAADRAYALFSGHLHMSLPGGELAANGQLTFVLEHGTSRWLIDTLVWSGGLPA